MICTLKLRLVRSISLQIGSYRAIWWVDKNKKPPTNILEKESVLEAIGKQLGGLLENNWEVYQPCLLELSMH